MLAADSAVVMLRQRPGRARRLVRHVTLASALLPLFAACTGSDSDSAKSTVTFPSVPHETMPPRTTVPVTTVLDTTSTSEATATTEPESQYAVYTVQPDLSVTPALTATHQVLWDLFRSVLGDAATAQFIETFTVYNDPNSNVDATVLNGSVPGKRQVSVNARYADDLKALARTFIHEYGHLVTLSGNQITADGNCATTSVDEGCLAANSYLNRFLDRFWWSYGQEVFDALASPSAMEVFYAAHQTDFVTRYAATDPLEDIAEVWAEFVITDAPAGATVAEQKILFLWGYPELVALRDEIRLRVGAVLGL